MDVEAAVARQREQPRRQDEAVGGDDDHVGRRGDERLPGRCRIVGEAAVQTQTARLADGDRVLEGKRLDRRRRDLHAAAGGSIGLGEDERDVEARGVQPGERDARELRRSGEGESHGLACVRHARPWLRRATSSASAS